MKASSQKEKAVANLEDLNYTSISDMSTDEALEHLRLIRLSRRMPLKKTKSKSVRKTEKRIPKIDPQTMNADQIAELLKTLGGSQK